MSNYTICQTHHLKPQIDDHGQRILDQSSFLILSQPFEIVSIFPKHCFLETHYKNDPNKMGFFLTASASAIVNDAQIIDDHTVEIRYINKASFGTVVIRSTNIPIITEVIERACKQAITQKVNDLYYAHIVSCEEQVKKDILNKLLGADKCESPITS